MLTDHELRLLLQKVNQEFQGTFQHLADLQTKVDHLETKVEELSNAKVQGPKTSTGGRKRVQQAKADA
jgi:hypothetical protein